MQKISFQKIVFVHVMLFATAVAAWGIQDSLQPIHNAVLSGNLSVVKEMLDLDQDVNAKTVHLRLTPLHIASQIGTYEMCRILIRRGADVNALDITGNTPLHYAAIVGRADIIELLLVNGADPNAQDIAGFTPLHSLIFHSADFDHPTQTHHLAVEVLLRARPRLDIRNSGGETPYSFASWNRFGIRRKVWKAIENYYQKTKLK